MRTMHLFAGVGGGLLADLILGHEPVVAVEWEPYACRVLRQRAEDGWFPGLHVWEGDVRLFDPSEYAGSVDCIHAGFPCQDISVAGKQAGVSEGTRSGLYREVLRIAGVIRPRYLFLENVAAIISNGLGTVLADLAAMGYDCRWICIRASDVGAPHHRDRWFLLADSTSKSANGYAKREDEACAVFRDSGETKVLADATRCESRKQTERERLEDSCGRSGDRGRTSTAWSKDVPYSDDKRREEFNAAGISEIQGWNGRNAAQGRGDCWWTTESIVGRVAHGIPNRVGQLKGYGNAQVPLQAAAAWRLLGGK